MGFFDLFKDEDTVREADTEFAAETETKDEATLRLREEELDIRKDRVKAGEVVLRKDIVEEEQNVAVPVSHDEVVIERRTLDHRPSDEPIAAEEEIRIPVTAERVDVDKHTVVREEITARKREVEETEHVQDVLHKEVAQIDAEGDAVVTGVDADSVR